MLACKLLPILVSFTNQTGSSEQIHDVMRISYPDYKLGNVHQNMMTRYKRGEVKFDLRTKKWVLTPKGKAALKET